MVWTETKHSPFSLLPPDGLFDPSLLTQVKQLELQGVSAAESGDTRTASQCFDQAIQLLPERPSAYNNRAQTRRLQGDTAGTASWTVPVIIKVAHLIQ